MVVVAAVTATMGGRETGSVSSQNGKIDFEFEIEILRFGRGEERERERLEIFKFHNIY